MDGFDDLLGPSRNALEDNPFANPFATQRSGSPDPWSTPFAASDVDAFGSTAHHFASSGTYDSPYDNAFGSAEREENDGEHENTKKGEEPRTPAAPSDPLDSALHNAEEDEREDEVFARQRSPGFKESLPATPAALVSGFSETATIRPQALEEPDTLPIHLEASTITPSTIPPKSVTENTLDPSSPIVPEIQPAPVPKVHTRTSTVSSLPGGTLAFKSPLDPSGNTGLERPIAGLALGGEAIGGWQSEEQAPWQSEAPFDTPKATATVDDDDSDDDKPILQTLHKHQSVDDKAAAARSKDDKSIQPVFVITVDDPQKVGDPIRSFTMYTVHTRTTSPLFQKSTFSVLRRYSDFLWLYETLSLNNPGVVVPPVPEKNTFGRFEDQFVKQRRIALEKCIQKIANHPVLMKDADLKLFLESDTFSLDIKHRKAELAHERGGLIASIGQSITGPRFYETDEWFDRQKVYLDSLESQLRGLVKAIEIVARHRAELATATGEFAQNVSDLSASDVGRQLAQSLSGLAEVEQKAQDLQNLQADADLTTIAGTVDEYARLINSVRMAFTSRIRVFHSWKNAENQLLRTKQTHERSRAEGRIPPDRLGYSLSQIAEAERRAGDAKHDYDNVSKLVKSEVARFEQERIEDFKDALQAFLDGMISRQKELISTWENYQQVLLKKVGGGGPAAAAAVGEV